MASPQVPTFIITYAQTQLLLAEAVVRNWTTGSAPALYANGVRAHMNQLSLYGTTSAVPVAAIDAYISANPLDLSKALEQINTQYWVASFLNGPEAFANFRRSGFPVLKPNLFPGKDLKTEAFIRRLTYPDAELNVNRENVQQAIGRMGPDILDTRVWWDVK
jgi:ABC-type spermidine/putrescine transport system permease subunit I